MLFVACRPDTAVTLNRSQNKSQNQKKLSTVIQLCIILGGMVASPFMTGEMAIAQAYPVNGVTAQDPSRYCLNIRIEPSADADIFACVPNGSTLTTVIREQGNWIQLSDGNWTWKNSTSLKTVFPIEGAFVRTQSECSTVHKAPSTAADIVDCLENGIPLNPIIKEENGWFGVAGNNWVWAGDVVIPGAGVTPRVGAKSGAGVTSGTGVASGAGVTTSGSRFPLINGEVQTPAGCSNVRQAPSATANTVGECLENGTQLNPIIKEQDGWYGFRSGNWIWADNVLIP